VPRFIPQPELLASPRHRRWTAYPVPSGAAGKPPAAADVVIVGAGPAGLSIAAALWHRGVRDVLLLDRTGRPCGRFFDRIDVLRQCVLRSPYEHHPGAEGFRDCELLDFARLHWSLLTPVERREIRMAQAGHRSVVPVDVFEAYCRHVAATHEVYQRTWRACVQQITPAGDAVALRTADATITARYVVLCAGEERRPAPWGDGGVPPGVSYWDEPVPGDPERLAVVGAGLSAAHLIANALSVGRQVIWAIRADAERYQCADINVAFFRPEGRSRFEGLAWDDRMTLMRAQRRASVMFEFRPLLRRAEGTGQLTVHRGRAIADVTPGPALRLAGGGRIDADHVVLALGTVASIGDELLPPDLAGARQGWPDLDQRTLEYARIPRVFAVGAAAGMALGPAARNIDGHRAASARVATAVASGLSRA
jgi:cation diffusion facilitator CzcD-associated flavoprotein CzcO